MVSHGPLVPNSFEIWPEAFDKILECFLLLDKATRFLHKVEIFEQVWKGIDQPSEYWWDSTQWFKRKLLLTDDGTTDGAGRTDILWPQRELQKGSTIQRNIKIV